MSKDMNNANREKIHQLLFSQSHDRHREPCDECHRNGCKNSRENIDEDFVSNQKTTTGRFDLLWIVVFFAFALGIGGLPFVQYSVSNPILRQAIFIVWLILMPTLIFGPFVILFRRRHRSSSQSTNDSSY
jgi:hypothetical protein